MYSMRRTPLAAALLLAINSPFYSSAASAASAPLSAYKTEFQVNSTTANSQTGPSIASDKNGDYVVVWQSNVATPSSPDYDIYAQRYHADGTPNGSEFLVNSYTIGNQTGPSVAMDATGDFVVAWASNNQAGSSSGSDIYAQRFNADGTKNGNEFLVNTHTTSTQNVPKVAMDDAGDFVIAWQSKGQDDPTNSAAFGVYAKRFDAAGNPVLDPDTNTYEFLVNTWTTDYQQQPSVAMDAGGAFVIAWQSYTNPQDTSYGGIFAQLYDATGHADTSKGEFIVNSTTTNTQSAPSVAMDSTGDFVVAWQSDVSSTSTAPTDYDIYAQRYLAGGTPNGSEFRVNSYTTGDQSSPSVAIDDSTGDFAISWQSLNEAGTSSVYDVYARAYKADGTDNSVNGSTGEFLVNTYTTSNQVAARIAMDDYGNFVIAWQSDMSATSTPDFDIYAQRYATSVDLNLVVNANTPVTAGNNFVYTLITTNNSTTNTATGVHLSEPLPTGLTYVSDDSVTQGWACSYNTSTIDCFDSTPLAPTASSTIHVTVTANTAGTLSNTVTLSSAQIDSNPADNTVTETTTVNPAPGGGGGGGALGVFTLLFAIPLWLRRRFAKQ